MDCRTTGREELLEKYLHGNLEPEAQDELELHLLECAVCARELEALQDLRSELILQANEIRQQTSRKPFAVRWPALALGSVLVAMVTVIGISHLPLYQPTKNHPVIGPSGSPVPRTDVDQALKGTENLQPGQRQPAVSKQAHLPAEIMMDSGTPKHVAEEGSAVSGHRVDPTPGPATAPGAKETAADTVARSTGSEGSPWPETLGPAAIGSKPKTENSSPGENGLKLTAQEGADLYRLGQAQAPPYIFSALNGKLSVPGVNSYGRPGSVKDSGRVLFQEGMREYNDTHYDLAAAQLQSALQYEPEAEDTNFFLGICHLLNGHPAQAAEKLRIAGSSRKSRYFQSAHYYLAKTEIQLLDLPGAEKDLRTALSVPGDLTTEAKQLLGNVQKLESDLQKNR